MATQMQHAREGKITDAMRQVAEAEQLTAETIREGIGRYLRQRQSRGIEAGGRRRGTAHEGQCEHWYIEHVP